MQPMTLREAAQRTARSITTLRRYIRSGRLQAEKRQGRFGPEYFVSEASLSDAGLEPNAGTDGGALATRRASPRPEITSLGLRGAERLAREAVPVTLYQELQMKHEQLLVQYGMMRAGGLRALELRGDLDQARAERERLEGELDAARSKHRDELGAVRRELREARLELEARALEIAALGEKVRALEMLTRNAETSESIERQYARLMEQTRRVERLAESPADDPRPGAGDTPGVRRQWRVGPGRPPAGPPAGEPEH